MPSLNEAINSYGDQYSSIEPVTPKHSPSISLSANPNVPVRNPFLRCPLPQVWVTNTDSLRQTFTTMVPQRRLFLPK